ncbi:MAG: NAD(P)/FAD-dependent oxidoreductase [Methanobacteriota archaeon]|nr:MAG: NAD(P)/FAD-dependent oxidoreductase [Euryarchaeota archaeon]
MADVIVVGAGPAGSTTARHIASHGLEVLVLDKREEIGRPVQCGELLASREEVLQIFPRSRGLDELDTVPLENVQRRFERLRILTPKGREYLIPFTGFTVNRDDLDKHWVSLAEKAGAEIRTGVVVEGLSGSEVITDQGRYNAKVIVGADGPTSIVATSANLKTPSSLSPALTCQVEGNFEPVAEMHFGSLAPGGYAWIIPKKKSANVGLGVWDRARSNGVRALFNDFITRRGFAPHSIAGGLVPMSGPVAKTVSKNVLIVGDAAGHVIPTNGGGVNVALICGRIAGECIAANLLRNEPLQRYEERWRAVVGHPLTIGLKTKRLADKFFGSDRRLELAMRIMGKKGMGRAIRCKRIFRG